MHFIIKTSKDTDRVDEKVKVLFHTIPELLFLYFTKIVVIYCFAT